MKEPQPREVSDIRTLEGKIIKLDRPTSIKFGLEHYSNDDDVQDANGAIHRVGLLYIVLQNQALRPSAVDAYRSYVLYVNDYAWEQTLEKQFEGYTGKVRISVTAMRAFRQHRMVDVIQDVDFLDEVKPIKHKKV